MKYFISLLFLFAITAKAVTLPYTFSSGSSISSSQVNANFSTLAGALNTHISETNAHNTDLQDVLAVNNSCGPYNINFNLGQGLSFRAENVTADPACAAGSLGRLIWNSTDSLFKICNGSSYVSIAGTGVNTLSSVLTAGNSAGSLNLDMNENQLLHARIENVSSNPSPGYAGRLIYNSVSSSLYLDTGSVLQAVGGAQGLSSVLGVSNSAGSYNINFNGNQAVNMGIESLASDPGTTYAGRIYYNSASNIPKFYNGSSWLQVGNTNTLAQTMGIGNSVGSNNLNMNGNQLINAKLENLAAPPGTGQTGRIWYDTGTSQLDFSTSSLNHVIATTDQAQTFTNKSFDASANTLTNVPDSALTSNIDKLNAAQTISATKTFTAAPITSYIKASSSATNGHSIPNVNDDTFTLNNAVQTLYGKTLNAPTLSGNLDFAEYQAIRMRVENLASTPAFGNAGRIIYKTTTGEILFDTGSSWVVIGSSGGSGVWGSITGTLSNQTDLATALGLKLTASNNLSDLGSASTARTNLGLGTVATKTAPSGSSSQMLANDGSGGFSNVTVGTGLSFSAGTLSATGGSATWGAITGTLSSQTDLNTALGLKAPLASPSFTGTVTIGSLSGILKSTTGAVSAASSGVDYQAPISSSTPVSHQFLTGFTAPNTFSQAQPACSDLSGVAASCSTDTTNASNISSGTLAAGRLPTPTASTLGGIESITSAAHNWVAYIDTSGVPHQSQPAFTDISGTATNAQLANSSISIAGNSTSLGGSVTQDQITGLASTGIVKRTAANTLGTAVAGTDYAPATSGSSLLKGNGLGGFSNAVASTDYVAATTGSAIQKASSGGLTAAVSGTDYAPATTGTSILKASSGGFANAVAGTDYAPATTGTSAQLLANDGSGGHANVTVGTGLSYTGGTLSASGSSASALSKTVTQSNSFSVGNVVYLSGSTYTLAQANSVTAAEVIGIVTVASGSQFTMVVSGQATGLSGLTAGTLYFLSPTTGGLLTSTEPSTAGQVDKPVCVADSTTSCWVSQYRGALIASATGNGPYTLSFGGAGSQTATTSCGSSPCTIYAQAGSWVSSVTRSATGAYLINVNSGIFSSIPICVESSARNVAVLPFYDSGVGTNSTTAIYIHTNDNTNTSTDAALNVICR